MDSGKQKKPCEGRCKGKKGCGSVSPAASCCNSAAQDTYDQAEAGHGVHDMQGNIEGMSMLSEEVIIVEPPKSYCLLCTDSRCPLEAASGIVVFCGLLQCCLLIPAQGPITCGSQSEWIGFRALCLPPPA